MALDTDQVLDEFYERLPEGQRLIATVLREIIHETLPGVKEKLSWNAPFFDGKRNVCYFWIPSKKGKRDDISFGICFNYTPQIDHGGYLDLAGRKRYGCHYFRDAEEIDVDALVRILRQVWALD